MNCDAMLDMDIQSKVSNLGYADGLYVYIVEGLSYLKIVFKENRETYSLIDHFRLSKPRRASYHCNGRWKNE